MGQAGKLPIMTEKITNEDCLFSLSTITEEFNFFFSESSLSFHKK